MCKEVTKITKKFNELDAEVNNLENKVPDTST